MRRALLLTTVLAALAATAPAQASSGAEPAAAAASVDAPAASQFERDRQSILAQAGQWRVRFDMRENVSFREGYEPLEEKLSAGDEIVRVVYDDGTRISLQHILVMGDDAGNHFVIKHWRQDWVYEPETVLTYAGPNRWTVTPVSAGERRAPGRRPSGRPTTAPVTAASATGTTTTAWPSGPATPPGARWPAATRSATRSTTATWASTATP